MGPCIVQTSEKLLFPQLVFRFCGYLEQRDVEMEEEWQKKPHNFIQRYSTTWIYEYKIEYTGLGLKFEAP